MRVDKFLSNMKYGTRKEVKSLVKDKRVKIDDDIVKSSSQTFDPNTCKVYLDDEYIYYKETIVLMLNKPSGYVSANYDLTEKTVLDLIEEPYNRFDLKIAGRLDKDTVGLVILTNNGELLHSIITPKKNVYKKYYVKTKSKISKLNKLTKEFTILDGMDRPFTPLTPIIEQISDYELYISIKEGKFHQVKRMIEYIDNEVIFLQRISIGSIVLDEKLEYGEYKEITLKKESI